MSKQYKFTMKNGTTVTNFFLKPTSESGFDMFRGAAKIGKVWRAASGNFKTKFAGGGEMWAGEMADPDTLLESAGKFSFLKDKRKSMRSELSDNDFDGFYAQTMLNMRFGGLDRDLAVEQAKRNHLTAVKLLDEQIEILSPHFTCAK